MKDAIAFTRPSLSAAVFFLLLWERPSSMLHRRIFDVEPRSGAYEATGVVFIFFFFLLVPSVVAPPPPPPSPPPPSELPALTDAFLNHDGRVFSRLVTLFATIPDFPLFFCSRHRHQLPFFILREFFLVLACRLCLLFLPSFRPTLSFAPCSLP